MKNFDPHPEILMVSNFNAVRHQYLAKFTADEINDEIKKLTDEGLLNADDSRFTLTDNGQDSVFGNRR